MNTQTIYPDFHAALTPDQLHAIEVNLQGSEQAGGVTRRMLLGVLTVDKKELLEQVKDREAAEALMEAAETGGAYIKDMENTVSLLNSAQARIFAILEEVYGGNETGEEMP